MGAAGLTGATVDHPSGRRGESRNPGPVHVPTRPFVASWTPASSGPLPLGPLVGAACERCPGRQSVATNPPFRSVASKSLLSPPMSSQPNTPGAGSRWPEATQQRAKDIIARYPQKRSAVMPLLYLAMSEDGWLTDDGMKEVAEWVGITPAQVQAVASFYTMYKRERTGRYLVSACTSISCMLLGGDDVLHAIEDESGVPHGETDDEGL
jgi:NADH:ubiquinone oxidoreductase subunit E